MIRVHVRREWWSSVEVDAYAEPWRAGLALRDLRPSSLVEGETLAWRNGALVDDHGAEVFDGDHVTFAPQPFGPSFLTAAKFLFWVAASTALNMILAPKLPPRRKSEDSSPTYGFGGISTARGEGFPIQRLLGRHRVGGTVISEVLDSDGFPPKQYYQALISFGLGPYSACGNITTDTPVGTVLSTNDPSNPIPTGIQINGNRAETYDNVEVQVRMGSLNQSTLPGFEFADTTVAVDQTLTAPTTTSSSNATYQLTFASSAVKATSDTAFSAYGRTQDYVTAQVDAARVTITFPSGLYSYDQTTGALAASNFQLCARYIELDSGGTPITSGGPEGDGYVRLAPLDLLSATQQGQFSVQYQIDFKNPQTFLHDTPGEAISFDGTNDAAEIAAPDLPVDAVTGQNLDTAGNAWGEMTVAAWINVNSTAIDGNFILDHIASWTTSSRKGFRFRLLNKTFFGGFSYMVPVLEIGEATGVYQAFEGNTNPSAVTPTFTISAGNWYHVAVTYIRNSSGSSEKIKIYGNGKLRYTILADHNMTSAGNTAAAQVGHTRDSSVSGTAAFMDGKADEVFWSNTALTAQEITTLYNAGAGKYLAAAGFSNVIALWHFDSSSGAAAWTTPDSSTAAVNALTMYTNFGTSTKGNLLTSSGSGKVPIPAATTPKRSRWRLELLRNNYDSTSASTSDQADWTQVAWRIDEAFSYPGHALLAIRVQASEQLNDTKPDITALWKGAVVGVWDGGSTTTPTFTQGWNANPAWLALDFALDKVTGLGGIFTSTDIDVLSFNSWAAVCDQLVYAHHGQYGDGAGVGWTDMIYIGSGGVGTLAIYWDADKYAKIRQYLEVGDYVGLVGVNTVGASINTPEGNKHNETLPTRPGGWPILAFNDAAKTMTLSVNTAPTNPWTSGVALSALVGGAGNLTGTVEDREFRHRCNLNIDEQRSAWDWLIAICATGRARPVRDGKRLRVVWESARTPVDLITQSSIIAGSFSISYGGQKDRANAYDVDLYDQHQNWERSSFPIEHPSVQNATTGEAVIVESKTFLGITSRAQAMRQALYELNTGYLLNRSGSFKTQITGLPLEPGDVVTIAHDLAGWAIGGRVTANSANTTTIVLDRDVTVTSAITVHTITVKDSNSGTVSTADVNATTTGSGAYPRTVAAGSTINLSTALAFIPQQSDEYAYTTPSLVPLNATIVGTKLSHEGEKEIEWIEYDPNVFDDDNFADLTEVDAQNLPLMGPTNAPPEARHIGISSTHETSSGGQHIQTITASWELDRDTLRTVDRVAVWYRLATDDADPWKRMAEVDGTASLATFKITAPVFGTVLQVAVQPISISGARLKPDGCLSQTVRVEPLGPAPVAPSSLEAVMEEDRAVYTWTPASRDRLLFTELRRGGWLLGQVIETAPPGSLKIGPTRDWAGGTANAIGETSTKIVARHISPTGLPGAAVTLTGFEPSVAGTFALHQFGAEVTACEDLWTGGMSGLTTVTLPSGRVALKFQGSNLTGTYTWPDTLSILYIPRRPRRVYVEAFVEADQVHPWAMVDMPPVDDPSMRRWTTEGPLFVGDGETANCTATLEIKVYVDDGTLAWRKFTPGIYRMNYCQFRWTVTRPNTNYQMRMYRAGCRILRVPFTHQSESGLQRGLEAMTLG